MGTASTLAGREHSLPPTFFSHPKDPMKVTLDKQEIIDLITSALRDAGFSNVEDIDLDLGDGNALPLELVQGLSAKVSR